MLGLHRSIQKQPQRWLQGIRFRLGLAMSLALLPIFVLAAAQTHAAYQAESREARRDLILAAERTAQAARSRLDGTMILLEALRSDHPDAGCPARMDGLVARVGEVEAIGRLNQDGQVLCASQTPAGHSQWLDGIRNERWWSRLATGAPEVIARPRDRPGEEPHLVVAIRLSRPLGGFDGAIVAQAPLSGLEPDVRDPALPQGTEAALIGPAGEVLAATEPEAFALRGEALGDRIDTQISHRTQAFEAADWRGRHRTYVSTAMTGRDVHVVLSAPRDNVFNWARLNLMGSLVLPLLTWLVALGAVMLVSDRLVVRWLAYLQRIAAIYGRGRYQVQPVQAKKAPTEIRVLANSLDDMADTIGARDASLKASLADKDGLLREIHHRVKNNLQIISSLLSMQQRALTDPVAKSALGDTRQRIAALAQIYRTLYQSPDLRHTDARIFIHDMVSQLVANEGRRQHLIETEVEADSLIIDPDKLAPLALWLVEAVSNAQKHAFADRGGQLHVRFKVRGDTSILEVEDDGPGMVENSASGVGTTLMTAFARQLRGKLEFEAVEPHGTLARMSFATPEATSPNDPALLGTDSAA